MTTHRRIYSALLAGALALALSAHARAQEDRASVRSEAGAPKTIQIQARKNPGNLPYGHYIYDQKLLDSYLPPRPRMIDFLWRISFLELSEAEQDGYQPQSWGVAVVGDGVDQTLKIARGGYFRLPELGTGRQNATIMFKEQSTPNLLKVAWAVNVGKDQRLTYAALQEAMDEVHAAQRAIPFKYTPLLTERGARLDGIKACFLSAGGELLVDGKPAADATIGHCAVLRFDPERLHGAQVIELKGPLQIVTVVDSTAYLRTGARAPTLVAARVGTPMAVKVSARRNAGDLAYDWVFENQQHLQGYLPPDGRAIDFSLRVSFRELDGADQDVWTPPRGWAVSVVGDGVEQDLPVARGGYFLLPTLPPGRRDATIMFKEQSRQGLIAAAWIVRVGAGQHLPYADFARALEQVRGVQAAIPRQATGLDQVRGTRYDGIKACFLGAGGAVLIDGVRVADAVLGDCATLKFNPDLAKGERMIEFRGPLQVVTLVETMDHPQPEPEPDSGPDPRT